MHWILNSWRNFEDRATNMADDYRRKIECEMDRFEAEISSLGKLPPVGGPPTTAFIPAQLRRHPAPAASGTIAAPPMINKQQQVTISGAPQVYRAPAIRQPIRGPVPTQTTNAMIRGVRPMIRPPPGAMVAATSQITFSARPTLSSPAVLTGVPGSAQQGFVPTSGMPIMGAPVMNTPPSNIPLPPEPTSSEPKPSTSSSSDANNDKDKNKKKKDKKPKKLVRSAGGTVWEDTSLQDWDPKDFRLFCGDLGNDVTDEVLTRVFGRYPSFQKARVIRDKRTNKTKGYGFVSFKDPNDFVRAVKELDGRYVGSRPIKLRKSNWKNRNVDVVRKRETERMSLLGINNKKPKPPTYPDFHSFIPTLMAGSFIQSTSTEESFPETVNFVNEEESNETNHDKCYLVQVPDSGAASIESEKTEPCKLCGRESTSFCRNCCVTYYCCKEHQISDWKRHKKICSSVKSIKDANGLRELVATKDIAQGEIFFQELPIIVFPFPKRQLQITCLECCSPIQTCDHVVPCSNCGWELCSTDCNGGKHHCENECKIFSKAKLSSDSISVSLQKYYIVGVIRVLLLKEKNPSHWALVQNLYFEQEDRNEGDHEGDETVIKFIRNNCNLERFDEGEIKIVLDILRSNTFNTVDNENTSIRNASLLFPTAIQAGPSCVANASLCIHGKDVETFKIFMRATIPISRGTFISPSPFEKGIAATFLRRPIKKRIFYRPCACDRCTDPTELGTYISAIKCKICEDGYCLQRDPLVQDSCWECDNKACGLILKNRDVMLIIEQISQMLSGATEGPFQEPSKASADFLLKCISKLKKELLHPNHFMILNVEMDICQRLITACQLNEVQGKTFPNVGTIITELATHVISVADVLSPGYSRLRGHALYNLQFGLVKDLLKSGLRTPTLKRQKEGVERGRKIRMEKLKQYQLEVENIFHNEPIDSKEKQLVCAMKGYMMVVDAKLN
ncbi:RNA-binding protein 42 [Orchesella cincta]|uniref:RNA-binding protein 42 n=1 Tax=Orchesella cincta TaxID=48709 RepID=A0A1D2MKV1_ORCCI|nr:RNA-binding protein 42 [Orchesella cincta]